MALSAKTDEANQLSLSLEFSEPCKSELRRIVNNARKAAGLLDPTADPQKIESFDSRLIEEFLAEEFYPFIANFWRSGERMSPLPAIRDWSYPGVTFVENAQKEESPHFSELRSALYEKGYVHSFSHSGLYNAKILIAVRNF
jgi:hypothetical protein